MAADLDFNRLHSACAALPESGVIEEERHVFRRPVLIAMTAVLSLNRRWYKVALPARQRFESGAATSYGLETLHDFEQFCASVLGPERDYLSLSQALWKNRERQKARQLVELIEYFTRWLTQNTPHLDELEGLQQWARLTAAENFLGRIKGLGPRGFEQLLWYLQDGKAVKLDRHVKVFIEQTLRRELSENETVSALTRVAEQMGITATALDARIWDHMQGKAN